MSAPLEREGTGTAELGPYADVTALQQALLQAEISVVALRAELAEANAVVQSMANELSVIVLAHARCDALGLKTALDNFMARRCKFVHMPAGGRLQ
ncbi:hypothetical protein LNV08_11800 [Paucibacter sp. TC2R-5]|uniref:hypothetical protein n=1 Tax=Paucibacter sp. TC2R-5 TaxID=2893555 RepID=UPI0021E3A1FF|nr:hypothetical protein [Paucibacter sp. TC2R-5]MCV2359653.1 hypothetical protein [Paucibacter sp. TC2R-5]